MAGVPWQLLRINGQVGGHGYSQKQISRLYRKYLNSKGIDLAGQSKWFQYLGATPGTNSATGRAVIERMRGEGRVLDTATGTFVRDADGTWYPLAEMDMGHNPLDAVRFWNTTRIQYGPKSPVVRQWMLDPNIYELQHFSRNRSLGAQLGETYIDP